MHLVPEPGFGQNCAVLPFRSLDDEGFIQTGHVLEGCDREVFVSASAVRAMANVLGLPDEREVEKLREQTEQMELRLRDLSRLVEAYESAKESEKTLQEIAA